MAGPPYAEYWADTVELTTEPQRFVGQFVMGRRTTRPPSSRSTWGARSRGASPSPSASTTCTWTTRSSSAATIEALAAPNVLVNQHGYLPKRRQVDVWESSATEPQKWQLLDSSGQPCRRARRRSSDPMRARVTRCTSPTSRRSRKAGRVYVVQVGADKSHPFDIDENVYEKLKYDALAFFYHQRSGVEIKMPYAGEAQLDAPGRPPAGQGVLCLRTGLRLHARRHRRLVRRRRSRQVRGQRRHLAVDAAEPVRARQHLGSRARDFGDGKLTIPENEQRRARPARRGALGARVPAEDAGAGGPAARRAWCTTRCTTRAWTALGTAPHEDTQPRSLRRAEHRGDAEPRRPTAAQGARIWKTIDAGLRGKCLAAAEKAWAAATKQPESSPPPTTITGGGPYDDNDVSDEFYWAAAELFVTTGKRRVPEAARASPLDKDASRRRRAATSMTWGTTDRARHDLARGRARRKPAAERDEPAQAHGRGRRRAT